MEQVLKVFGQTKPAAATPVDLFVVDLNNQAQITIFITNQSVTADTITIAIVPSGDTLGTQSYVAYNTPVYAGGILSFSGVYLNSSDKVVVSSENGDCSFTATGVEFIGPVIE